jgi:hypothetical protein
MLVHDGGKDREVSEDLEVGNLLLDDAGQDREVLYGFAGLLNLTEDTGMLAVNCHWKIEPLQTMQLLLAELGRCRHCTACFELEARGSRAPPRLGVVSR